VSFGSNLEIPGWGGFSVEVFDSYLVIPGLGDLIPAWGGFSAVILVRDIFLYGIFPLEMVASSRTGISPSKNIPVRGGFSAVIPVRDIFLNGCQQV
jgi:hypothetical protein